MIEQILFPNAAQFSILSCAVLPGCYVVVWGITNKEMCGIPQCCNVTHLLHVALLQKIENLSASMLFLAKAGTDKALRL